MRAPEARTRRDEIKVLQDETVDGSVTTDSEVGFFGDEERLTEQSRLRAYTEPSGPGSHKDVKKERALLICFAHGMEWQQRKDQSRISLREATCHEAV